MECGIYFWTIGIGIPMLAIFWKLSGKFISDVKRRRMIRAFLISLVITPVPLFVAGQGGGGGGALIPPIAGLWWTIRMALSIDEPMRLFGLLFGLSIYLFPSIIVTLLIFWILGLFEKKKS